MDKRRFDITLVDMTIIYPDKRFDPYTRRIIEDIDYFVIHHTATKPTPYEYASKKYDSVKIVEGIYNYHTKNRNWPGIGYHYIITNKGEVFYCGSLKTIRYGVAGKNAKAMHVALLGDFTKYDPDETILKMLYMLYSFTCFAVDKHIEITTHKRFALPQNPTACPGNWDDGRIDLRRLIGV